MSAQKDHLQARDETMKDILGPSGEEAPRREDRNKRKFESDNIYS